MPQANGANGAGPSDYSIPQISRKIKACAACRRHKVNMLYLGGDMDG